MKTLSHIPCLIITAAALLCSRNTAYAVGATLPFTSYEAEAGTLGGGASTVALTSRPTTQYSSPVLEASGHAYVQLTGTGQYVEWTNNTGQNITAINLRSSIPDASGGGGITSTIDLYVNGVFRQAFNVNSQQNYCYEGKNYNDQTDKNPADGHPRDFWNDTHAFVTGAAIAPGSTFRFEKDSANSAAFYYIDVVDVENPPAALSQPANSLSITSYGAQANNSSFDNTSAINNCFSAAKAQGKIAWIPAGTFYFSAIHGGLSADGITIDGAGPWYTTLYRVTPANNTIGIANIITATSTTLQNLHLDCNGNSRATNNNDGAVDFSGSNWLVNNVWIEHVTSSFWCAGDHGEAENCRTDSNWSDGGNFNNVQDSRGIGEFLTYTNNFVRGEGDDAMAINSVHDNGGTILATMSNITYSNNTVMAMWGGKGMGIYGGSNVLVTNNLISDSARYIGLGVGRFGVDGSDLTSGTVTGNVLVNCGGNGYNQEQPALQIGNGGDGQSTGLVENVTVSGNTVIDSIYNGVGFSTCTNINFNNNIVNSPGLDGIVISPAFFPAPTGSASITDNTVTGVASGETAYADDSSGFTATLSGNTWQGGPGAEAPYGGTAAAIPGTIQAENYDIGGQGAAYNVTSINGTDNGYRPDGVDLEVTSDTGGGVDLGWTSGGQLHGQFPRGHSDHSDGCLPSFEFFRHGSEWFRQHSCDGWLSNLGHGDGQRHPACGRASPDPQSGQWRLEHQRHEFREFWRRDHDRAVFNPGGEQHGRAHLLSDSRWPQWRDCLQAVLHSRGTIFAVYRNRHCPGHQLRCHDWIPIGSHAWSMPAEHQWQCATADGDLG